MSTTKVVLLGIAALIAIPIVVGAYMSFTSVVTAPGRVVNETLRTDNIIYNYEWFHDQCARIVRLETSLQAQRTTLDAVPADSTDASRTRQNINGLTAERSQAIADYNANATKTNVSIFQGTTLPKKLDPNTPTVCN